MDEKTKYGLQVFGEMMGRDKRERMEGIMTSTDFGAAVTRLALQYAFADVWGRPGLARKERSLVTIGTLIATRQVQELKNHVRIGVTHGLTAAELDEVLVQAVPYIGFPAVASAKSAMLETLRELGLDSASKTPEERGLL